MDRHRHGHRMGFCNAKALSGVVCEGLSGRMWSLPSFVPPNPHRYRLQIQYAIPDRPDCAYGPNYTRLCEVKAKYDPENRFRRNQNIRSLANAG